jgi:hypothetical protein
VPEQGAVLRHQPDPAPLCRDVDDAAVPCLHDEPAREVDGARLDPVEPRDCAQQCGLARAGAAQHGQQRARRYLEVDAAQHRASPVPGDDAVHSKRDHALICHGALPGWRSTRSNTSAGTAASSTSATA